MIFLLDMNCRQWRKPPKLSDDQLRLILTRLEISDEVMAQQMGRTREAIRQVRNGVTYVDRCPELPRRVPQAEPLTCLTCKHWRGCCGFDLPDPVEEGISFARDCSLYAA